MSFGEWDLSTGRSEPKKITDSSEDICNVHLH